MAGSLSKTQYKQLVKLLLKLSRYDLYRLNNITRQQFGRKTNTINSVFKDGKCRYSDVKQDAMNQLIRIGAANPVDLNLKDGVYLIVSDSHGKHTNRGMFRLLNVLNSFFCFKNIIHIGNAVDDDNDISYLWKDFKNLIIVAKDQQRQQLQKHKQDYKYDVINGSVYINGLRICNQQIVKDYSKTSISLVDSYLYQQDCIFNGHKQQLVNKGCYDRSISYYCPGCVCQPHIITTVKQIDFKDGRQVKESYPTSYLSYRNRKHLLNYWENGIVIVQAKNGKYSVHPIRIKKVDNQYVTSYFDKIFTQTSILVPDKKVFFNSDLHASLIDNQVLGLQQQFVKDYKPDVYVNLGDTLNCKSINHHQMQKQNYIEIQLLQQLKSYYNVMNRISQWAQQKHIVFGNHQRFMNDFVSKYPQFKDLFQLLYMAPIKQFNYVSHNLKTFVDLNGLKFLHGDLKLFGQSGTYLDKVSKTFGSDTVVGHLHVNEIKRGCYVVGLTGLYNQQYNDVCGSRWQHGFGFSNQYKGVSFTQLVSMSDYKFIIGNKYYQKSNNQEYQQLNQLQIKLK